MHTNTYKAFKSGGKWFLQTSRGKLLAQEFDTIGALRDFVKLLGAKVII